MFLRLLSVNGCLEISNAAKHLQKMINDNPGGGKMCQHCLCKSHSFEIAAGITGDVDDLSLRSVVADLRKDLNRFDFDISTAHSEKDGKAYMCLVNTATDGIAKEKPFLDSAAIKVLRVVLEWTLRNGGWVVLSVLIFLGGLLMKLIVCSMSLSYSTAAEELHKDQQKYLKRATAAEGVTFTAVPAAEWKASVTRLVETGYLEIDDETQAQLFIGPRTRAELGHPGMIAMGFTDELGRKCHFCGQPCIMYDQAGHEADGFYSHAICRARKNSAMQRRDYPGAAAPAAAPPQVAAPAAGRNPQARSRR